MKRLASLFLVSLCMMQAVVLIAQAIKKPEPTFALSIEEDKNAARIHPGLYRLLVKFTRVTIGAEVEQFHEEAMGMYEMIVLHDGLPATETDAMRDLRAYRKADDNPTLRNARLLKTGESWTIPLDVSDYYDMTGLGAYQITVTRESLPLHLAHNLPYSTTVRSNTINIVVSQGTGGTSAQTAKKAMPRFALVLSAEDPGDVPPLFLRVELDNTSNSVIRERKCWPFMGMYNLVVLRDGELVDVKDGIERLRKSRAAVACPGNETLLEVKPGAFYADRVPLSNFYVEKPGSYSVYVTRETYPYNPAKSVLVESNAISFVVPEPPPVNDTSPMNTPSHAPQ
ncbi:MAG: hypothetical protein ABSE51_24515 [Terracidiphilus sp.]|jgi:hypothetical protein